MERTNSWMAVEPYKQEFFLLKESVRLNLGYIYIYIHIYFFFLFANHFHLGLSLGSGRLVWIVWPTSVIFMSNQSMPRQRNSNLRILHDIQIRMNFQNSTKVLRINNVKYHMTKGEPINRAIGKVMFSLNLGIVKSLGSLWCHGISWKELKQLGGKGESCWLCWNFMERQ